MEASLAVKLMEAMKWLNILEKVHPVVALRSQIHQRADDCSIKDSIAPIQALGLSFFQ